MNSSEPKRRITALMMADVVGYSRLVGQDEAGTVARVRALRQGVLEPAIAAKGGRLVKAMGDGFLVEFGSAVDAASCAVDIQQRAGTANASSSLEEPLCLRIGVHVGDVLLDGDDLLGDGVNVVARLEGLADPGGVTLSADTHRHVEGKLPYRFEDAGEHSLKNIAKPMRVYRWQRDVPASAAMIAAPLALPDKPSIAVLPFTNMSGDPEQEYFADGMVEEIITALSRVRWLFVIARNSSFTYKGKAVDIKRVGRELGVRYVLEGSVRRAGNRVRITGQLIDASNGAHIWAERYDRELADIFALQDEVTQSVVSAIEPSLRALEVSLTHRKPTQNLDAHDLYLRAVSELDRHSKQSYLTAEELLRTAITKDNYYADAWTSLGDCLLRLAFSWPFEFQDAGPDCVKTLLRALELDSQNGLAFALAANAMATFAQNFEQSVKFSERALGLHPNSAFVRTNCAVAYLRYGNLEQALEQVTASQRLNPADPRVQFTLNTTAAIHFFARHFEDCIRVAKESQAHVPEHIGPLRLIASSLFHLGRFDEAKDAGARLIALHPRFRISNRGAFAPGRPWMTELMDEGLRGAGLPE